MKIAGYEPNKRVLVIVGGIAATHLISSYLLKLYFRYKKNQQRKAYPADTVILHQFPVKEGVPSISTPCLKLETWLRLAEIKYQVKKKQFFRPLRKLLFYWFQISRMNIPIWIEGNELNKYCLSNQNL